MAPPGVRMEWKASDRFNARSLNESAKPTESLGLSTTQHQFGDIELENAVREDPGECWRCPMVQAVPKPAIHPDKGTAEGVAGHVFNK